MFLEWCFGIVPIEAHFFISLAHSSLMHMNVKKHITTLLLSPLKCSDVVELSNKPYF